MHSETIELKADLMPRTDQRVEDLKSRDLMDRLLSKGYYTLILDGALIELFSPGIFGFVEEDARLLLDAYLHLERLLGTSDPYQHGVFVNDGLLSLTATSDRKTVDLEFRYCPELNVANLVTHPVTLPEQQYTWWWRSIAHELLTYADARRSP